MDISGKERFVLSYHFREFSPWLHSPIPKVITAVGARIPGVASLDGRQKVERREPALRFVFTFLHFSGSWMVPPTFRNGLNWTVFLLKITSKIHIDKMPHGYHRWV